MNERERERQHTGRAPNQRGGPLGAGTGGTRVNVQYGETMDHKAPTHGPGAGAPGQQKTHTVTRVNPDTGETETQQWTQDQWRTRDKSAGWTRPDDDGTEEPEPTV